MHAHLFGFGLIDADIKGEYRIGIVLESSPIVGESELSRSGFFSASASRKGKGDPDEEKAACGGHHCAAKIKVK